MEWNLLKIDTKTVSNHCLNYLFDSSFFEQSASNIERVHKNLRKTATAEEYD